MTKKKAQERLLGARGILLLHLVVATLSVHCDNSVCCVFLLCVVFSM